MKKLETFDNYFKHIETKPYHKNLPKNEDFYVFKNRKIIVSLEEQDDSMSFDSLGEFQLLLMKSKHFNEDNCYHTINYTNREIKRLGSETTKPFYISFEFTS